MAPRAVLTGGTGYLGQWVIRELLDGGWQVREEEESECFRLSR
jgi:thioester reductase-like protein